MSKAVVTEDLSGVRISIEFEDQDREMAYATVKDGEITEGHIHYGPKYQDPSNLPNLRKWALAVESALADTAPQDGKGGEENAPQGGNPTGRA